MPYVIAVVVVIVGAIAFFVLRSPAEAPAVTEPTTETRPAEEEAANTETVIEESSETEPSSDDDISIADTPTEIIEETIVEEVAVDEFTSADDRRTFSATASYLTPRRTNHDIEVTLTLKDRVVVSTEVLYDGEAGASTPSHSAFDAAYEAEVIGKTLNEINLSRVGGASLTSTAFNEAVAAIRSQS